MSNLPIPPPPPDDPPPAPDGVSLPHRENANFFLQVVDFYRPLLQEILAKVPVVEMPFLLAFLQGALESQMEEAAGGFEEAREFFRVLYPPFLKGHLEIHPDDTPAESEILIVIPAPAPNLVALNQEEPPRIIVPGSQKVN